MPGEEALTGFSNALIAVVGPTAVGKTAVGIALARRLHGEIISADAVAVYRGLDIGSAKPDAREKQQAVFHLLDVANPDEDFTVADFAKKAESAVEEVRARGRTPLLVGGTGLYVRSVTATLTVPAVPPQPELRAALGREAETQGAPFLHRKLAQIDPEAAERILPGDARRIIRALEVYIVSGRTQSSFHTPEGVQGIPRPDTHLFGLTMDRERLYRRIEARVDAMLEAGFLDEVRALKAAGYHEEHKAMQSLGYRHLLAYLNQKIPLNQAVEELKRDTRRFAKRQLSWFQADPSVHWINLDSIQQPRGLEGHDTAPMAEAAADAIVTLLGERTRAIQNTHSARVRKDVSNEQDAG